MSLRAFLDRIYGRNRDKSVVLRTRHGKELLVAPDLDRQLPRIVSAIRRGTPAAQLVQYTFDGGGRFVAVESTWVKLIQELLFHCDRVALNEALFFDALLSSLDVLGSRFCPKTCWRVLRDLILSKIDVLSGWTASGFANRADDVVRRGDHYYTTRFGEETEIIGARTITENRWAFIFNDTLGDYGTLKSILRVAALRNACVHYRSLPKVYPDSIRLRLSERDDETWYLFWRWEIPWPYERKYVAWNPECPESSIEYLANDLLAWFADREHLPERDTLPVELADDERAFLEKTRAFQWQKEFALDTELAFGNKAECWFEFRGHPFRWINRTAHVLTTLVVPMEQLNDPQVSRKALEFLSALVFQEKHAINIVTSAGTGRRRLPLLRQPHQMGGVRFPDVPIVAGEYPSGSRKALAIAIYAEGVNSTSIYYSFLSFYKVVELAHNGEGKKVGAWIDSNIENIRPCPHFERLAELAKTQTSVGFFLYETHRSAIAHAGRKPIADPDNPFDRERVSLDLPIIRAFARKAIDDGLFAG